MWEQYECRIREEFGGSVGLTDDQVSAIFRAVARIEEENDCTEAEAEDILWNDGSFIERMTADEAAAFAPAEEK